MRGRRGGRDRNKCFFAHPNKGQPTSHTPQGRAYQNTRKPVRDGQLFLRLFFAEAAPESSSVWPTSASLIVLGPMTRYASVAATLASPGRLVSELSRAAAGTIGSKGTCSEGSLVATPERSLCMRLAMSPWCRRSRLTACRVSLAPGSAGCDERAQGVPEVRRGSPVSFDDTCSLSLAFPGGRAVGLLAHRCRLSSD